MRKYKFLFLAAVLALIPASLSFAQTNETVTVTTYYPAPYGEYREVKLTPTMTGFTPFSSCSSNGTMLFDNTTQNVYVCKGSPATWQPLGYTVSSVYSVIADSYAQNCGGGCTKIRSLGSTWRFCSLIGYKQRIFDHTEQHAHDVNQCFITQSSGKWTLTAYYNQASGNPGGYTQCYAQCIK